jgi:hypothetical protein
MYNQVGDKEGVVAEEIDTLKPNQVLCTRTLGKRLEGISGIINAHPLQAKGYEVQNHLEDCFEGAREPY